MTPEAAVKKACLAAHAWGGLEAIPCLINNRENAVFDIRLKDGSRGALRLHRMGYQPTAAIEAELQWTERLHGMRFQCPTPIHTQSGQLCHELPDGQIASVVSWINAQSIGENGVTFTGTAEEHCDLYYSVGRLIARLHMKTRSIDTTGLQRPSWESDALLGENPHWGRFWENPSLAPEEKALLVVARENAAQHLTQLSPPVGLIHADLLQENILQNADGLWLIDFDDGGYGYQGYDLGTALIQHAGLPYLDALSAATITGYESICGPQSSLIETLPLFMMLRSMASCGWIISRAKPSDPRQRLYAERALRCVDAYLQTTTANSF